MQLRTICKAKIHGATVTRSDLDYIGSIGIDAALMKRADIVGGERVAVWNVSTGARIETYAIPLDEGSGEIVVNGAAAHHFRRGDRVIIVSFVLTDERIRPRMFSVDGENAFSQWLSGDSERQPEPQSGTVAQTEAGTTAMYSTARTGSAMNDGVIRYDAGLGQRHVPIPSFDTPPHDFLEEMWSGSRNPSNSTHGSDEGS